MDTSVLILTSVAVVLALLFDFTNGFHDAANQVATAITSHSIEPTKALILAAVGEFIGAYFLGTRVAETIGKGIIDPRILEAGATGIWIVISALVGAIAWNGITWWVGFPSSSSHALLGGLLGAFVTGWGVDVIQWNMVGVIFLVMLVSPVIGLFATFLMMRIVMFVFQGATPRINALFRKVQVLTSFTQALAHGTNDAQKTMGVITFVLVLAHFYVPPTHTQGLPVPGYVVLACSLVIALGTTFGGWRIIKTLGTGLYRVRPVHGMTAQTTSSGIIYFASLFGYPISTTQVISSSIMGAGAALRIRMVRWGVAGEMALAWLITIPAAGLLSALAYRAIKLISLTKTVWAS